MRLFTVLLITALSVFVLGNIYRVVRMFCLPAHLRWELYPIPKGPRDRQRYGGSYFEEPNWWTKSMQPDVRSQVAFVLEELFLLRTVLKNFRALWVWSLFLHWALYLYIVATAIALGLVSSLNDVPSAAFLPNFAYVGYGAACALGVIGALGLIGVRVLHPRLKGCTSRTTAFNLCLLGSIFATGAIALLLPGHGLLPALRDTVDWRSAFGGHWSAAHVHFGLVALFLVYFPFSHMTHMYMKYFMWHGVRWDDLPTRFDERKRQAVAKNLARQVSWQAPHIKDANPQSWADVASRADPRGDAGHA
jgi:nitrate reductase gamma subunit